MTKVSSQEPAVIHGIDLADGQPLRAPQDWDSLQACIRCMFKKKSPAELHRERLMLEDRLDDSPRHGQPPATIDVDDLASAGWGILFARDADPAVVEALQPLIEHRRRVAGTRCKVFTGREGLQPGESARDWLLRRRVTLGSVTDPDKVPYYLVVVGLPTEIPFEIDYELSMTFAVGRIAFDTPAQCAAYAANVMRAEADPHKEKSCAVVAPVHPGDKATEGSRRVLVEQLFERLDRPEGWSIHRTEGSDAKKGALLESLQARPSFFYFAGHGSGSGYKPELLDRVGSLICAEWPGPQQKVPITPDQYVAGSDIDSLPELDLTGTVSLLFGCHTAGQPSHDSFCQEPPRQLAPEPRVSALAQAMLGRPNGALAVLGHVDRAWSYSYRWRCVDHSDTFEQVFTDLFAGRPIGYAMRHIGDRYLRISSYAGEIYKALSRQEEVDSFALAEMVVTHLDAKSYHLLGDPAVRPGGL